MPARGEDGLFGALETELKKAKEPLDCATLFERASIRAHASSVNRVSDYLGHLWRKGKVLRLPAPKDDNTRARWMYVWKPQTPPPKPTLADAMEKAEQASINKLLSRPNIEITEEGDSVVITLPAFTITIKKH
jgi:hypothetical protein